MPVRADCLTLYNLWRTYYELGEGFAFVYLACHGKHDYTTKRLTVCENSENEVILAFQFAHIPLVATERFHIQLSKRKQ